MLIGIAGKARSGKDTIARWFVMNQGFIQYAFADPLKRAASEMFGVPLSHFYDDKRKETVNSFWGISPREMAQKLGTECGRKVFFDDIWVRRAQKEAEENLRSDGCAGVIISDVRFDNEAEWIRSEGGIIIHVSREQDAVWTVRNHVSEAGVTFKSGDLMIKNFWHTVDGLYAFLKTTFTEGWFYDREKEDNK